jgi:hypothetical protein
MSLEAYDQLGVHLLMRSRVLAAENARQAEVNERFKKRYENLDIWKLRWPNCTILLIIIVDLALTAHKRVMFRLEIRYAG